MSATITHTCDRCHETRTGDLKEHEDWALHNLEIRYQDLSAQYQCEEVYCRVQWCKKCLLSVNILPRPKLLPPKDIPQPAMSLEEQIREIVREEIGQNNG